MTTKLTKKQITTLEALRDDEHAQPTSSEGVYLPGRTSSALVKKGMLEVIPTTDQRNGEPIVVRLTEAGLKATTPVETKPVETKPDPGVQISNVKVERETAKAFLIRFGVTRTEHAVGSTDPCTLTVKPGYSQTYESNVCDWIPKTAVIERVSEEQARAEAIEKGNATFDEMKRMMGYDGLTDEQRAGIDDAFARMRDDTGANVIGERWTVATWWHSRKVIFR